MPLGAMADLGVVLHLGFLSFVGLGGLLARRSAALARAHLPGLVWGMASIGLGLRCPLTNLEKWLRSANGWRLH